MRKTLKKLFWTLFGSFISRLVSKYAADGDYAADPQFQKLWHDRKLVVLSEYHNYKQDELTALARFLAPYADRPNFYEFWQNHGFFIYPNNYLSPLPDLRLIQDAWQHNYSLAGLQMNDDAQLKLVTDVFTQYLPEFIFPAEPTQNPADFHTGNRLFIPTDAQAAYCLVRSIRPKRMIEIGSGYSTRLLAAAARRNSEEDGVKCEFTAVDPSPQANLEPLQAWVRHYPERIETLPDDMFLSLEAGDILFIDSSHVARIGSDVTYLMLNVLPRLKPGVYVHVHDIFLPFEYLEEIVKDFKLFLNEQYLFHAFLAFNDGYDVIWAGHYMGQRHSEFVKNHLGVTEGRSFWIRRRAEGGKH